MPAHAPLRLRGPYCQFYEYQPPRPWPRGAKLPLLADIDSYEHIHRQRDDWLKRYVLCERRDWQSMPLSTWQEMLTRNASHLFPCNAEARIAVAKIICAEAETLRIADATPHHWVTFAPRSMVMPIEIAHNFDVRRLQAMVRQALGQIPFYGFVEAALYIDWGPDGPAPGKRFVSFHVHFIGWNTPRDVLKQALRPLCERHENMVGRSSVWVRGIRPDEVESKLLYMSKGQIKEYRINAKAGCEIDETTGVITQNTRQQKRWMRTGEHVRMCNVLQDHRVDQLFFGNGEEGSYLARKVRYEACRPFCAWAEHLNRAAVRSGRPEPYPLVEQNRALGVRLCREAVSLL